MVKTNFQNSQSAKPQYSLRMAFIVGLVNGFGPEASSLTSSSLRAAVRRRLAQCLIARTFIGLPAPTLRTAWSVSLNLCVLVVGAQSPEGTLEALRRFFSFLCSPFWIRAAEGPHELLRRR